MAGHPPDFRGCGTTGKRGRGLDLQGWLMERAGGDGWMNSSKPTSLGSPKLQAAPRIARMAPTKAGNKQTMTNIAFHPLLLASIMRPVTRRREPIHQGRPLVSPVGLRRACSKR